RGTLREFAEKDTQSFGKYYGKAADMSNLIVALDTMLVQDGFYLRIKKGVKLEKPLQLVNILQNGMPLMAVRRMLIIVESGAEAKLLVCDHTQNPDVDFLSLETIEIFVEENASFDFYSLEESTVKTHRISSLYLEQKQESHVVIDGITLYNGESRNEYFCKFKGENASLRLLGMGIEDDDRSISTFSRITHAVPRCKSDELFKYSIDDYAHGSFTGRIYVSPGAVKTEAYQSNRNLVGSNTARMESKPELEIYNDDVKCSHGSATGQLDPMEMFYMRTRGIDEPTARLLLKQAFMADIIDGVRVDVLRDRLHLLVERRFAGASSACASCAGCRIPEE
ncbi:MAG: SufD family Fe-S cluster assembly protein, partial [Muribaculaceae bacterium]|nr:SufD family Fe-S cluster assembly protein [Muribaculaceae bacterium]